MIRHVAVDWSGSLSAGGSETWLAAVEDGLLVSLQGPLTRGDVVRTLVEWHESGRPLVAGLDFGFSFPSWYVAHLGCRSATDLWALASVQGETWLSGCQPPFWGRPGRRRGPEVQVRRTELEATTRPKSVFQVGGAGSVGTGSIRGMPALLELRRSGLNVWPFDAARGSFVAEIYPRLLTGPGPKSNPAWRRGYLDSLGWPSAPASRDLCAASEDSFDAAVSALRMWEHRDDLRNLESARDAIDRLEGRIWMPPAPNSCLATRKL